MKKINTKCKSTILMLICLFFHVAIFASASNEQALTAKSLPINIQAGFCFNVLSYIEKPKLDQKITIYVVNNTKFAQMMKKVIGRKIDESTIVKITDGDGRIPKEKPTIIYLDYCTNLDGLLRYCKANKIFTMTGNPMLMVTNDVMVGTGSQKGKPIIFFNNVMSKNHGYKWKTEFHDLVQIVKK